MCLCSPPCSRPAAPLPHTILFQTKTTWRPRALTGQKAARQPQSSPTILKRRAGELDFFCRAEHLLPLILIFMSYLACQNSVLRIRDPVLFDPWIRYPEWVKSPHPGWTTGWKTFGYGIRDKHYGSATLPKMVTFLPGSVSASNVYGNFFLFF